MGSVVGLFVIGWVLFHNFDSFIEILTFLSFYSRLNFNGGESGDDEMDMRAPSQSYTSSSSHLYVVFPDSIRRYFRVSLFRNSFGEWTASLLAPYR